jgi:hypothetical protein
MFPRFVFAACVLGVVGLGGCDSTEPGTFPSAVPADLQACTEVADCVVVELGCCDACNGGLRAAFNVDVSASTIDGYREVCTDDVACTELACFDAPAACVNDLCIVDELNTAQ